VNTWALPSAAGVFWTGLVVRTVHPGWLRPWMALCLGAAALIGAWLAAPRSANERPRPLEEAGLALDQVPSIEALTRPDVEFHGSGSAAAALAVIGVFAIAVGWGGVHEARLAGSTLASLAPGRVTVVGTLQTDPALSGFGWSSVVDATEVRSRDEAFFFKESVWVSGELPIPTGSVRGDRVELGGTLRLPDDPGFAETLRHKGIAVSLDLSGFQRLGPSPNVLIRATQVFRAFVGRTIARLFPPEEAGLLLGLVLGDDSHLDPALERDFQATGLGHLLVVSGENVSMVLAPMLALAVWLGLTRWPRFLLCLVTVGFFVVLTGAEPSVLRAGVMATLTLVGVLMGRPRSTASILAGAVLVLLVLDPWLVWSIGFQLSVAATGGMVTLATPLAERIGRLLPAPIALAAGTTIAAQLGVTPLLLFHFHEVPGVTILANLAAFPAVAPSLLMGIAASLAGLVWLPAGRFVSVFALAPMRYLRLIADTLAKAPIASVTTRGGPVVLFVGGALFVMTARWLRVGTRPPRVLVVVTIAALPIVVWSSAVGVGAPSTLTVRFFDVGQGDSALVTSPSGAAVLIDGGPEYDQVATELAALGVKRLDVVVASHPHADHVVGLPFVLARVQVGLVLQPGCPDTSTPQADLDGAIANEGVEVQNPRTGSTYAVGDLRMDILSPDRCWAGTESDTNNDALVVRLSRGEDTILLATEPEEPAQEWLLESGQPLIADVLKVPHHGAATSIPEFFEAVHAQVAVVSVGENTYGHPVPSTLTAVEATGAQVWRTDQHGTITVAFDDGVPVVTAER
jgi:competence protein ComEC